MIAARLIGGDAIAARFAAMPRAIAADLAETADRLSGELRRAVERNLSGAVLKQRSGRLAASIDVSASARGGRVSVQLGTGVRYAAIHEYGGQLPARTILPKSARALAFPWHGRERFFRRVGAPPTRMPERSFLRSALAEMAPQIRTALAAAVDRSVAT